MAIRFNLKHMFAVTTVAAMIFAFFHWCGLLLGLFVIVNVLLMATYFVPIGTSARYWWLLIGGAFVVYLFYELAVPSGMNIRVDLVWLCLLIVALALLHFAKMGDAALQKRRRNKSQSGDER